MSSAKTAKDALEHAYTAFKSTEAVLKKTLELPSANPRVLKNRMSKFEEALESLTSCHTAWILKAELTDTLLEQEEYSRDWLATIWTNVSDIEDQYDTKYTGEPSEPPVQNNKQKLLICAKQMDTLKHDLSTKISHLLTALAGESLSGSCNVYTGMLSNVKDNLNGQFADLMQQILSLDPGNLDDNLNTLETFRKDALTSITKIELSLAEKTPSHSSPQSSATKSRGVEMEKCRAPTFSGNTIDYPEFKRGWNKVAGNAWDDGNQVEQIKLKVNTETRRIITRCKTMNEVWEALDLEFAQEGEVLNAVNEELRKLRSAECSTEQYIVNLRNNLPNLEDALNEVKGVDHLHSPDKVNFMVERFDALTLREWDRFKSKESGTTYERFFKFLLDQYQPARSAIARQRSRPEASSTFHVVRCSSCNLEGHFSGDCQQHMVNRTTVSTESECKRCNTWLARDSVYTCPGCGRGTHLGQKIHHCLEHCGAFMSMSVTDRSNCIEKALWYPVHLSGTHQYSDCSKKNDPRVICGVDGCTKHHHKLLHNSTNPYIATINSTAFGNADNVLLLVQTIQTPSGTINCFWDNGSTCSLISRAAAKRLNLTGEAMSISIKTVTGWVTIDSVAYSLTIIDIHGQHHIIVAFCVDEISNKLETVDISKAKNDFPEDIQSKWHLLRRPTGDMELLVGLNAFSLHPSTLATSGNLKVMASRFGTGYLLGGSHPHIKSKGLEWNDTVSNIRIAHSINKITVKPSYDFFEGEIMGISPPKRCGNCMRCNECSFRAGQMSQMDQYEYSVIESKVTYVESQQFFHVQYPFTEDPRVLENNRGQVIKVAERLEKKLVKENQLQQFNYEFQQMVEGGRMVELSQKEMDLWDGAVHYVSLQSVINEDSTTTKLRIVTNSSISDKRGTSLNGILMKGGNSLSDQWELLNRFRLYEEALRTDVSKAYWSLRTGEVEKHVRRIVWRDGNPSKPWKTYGLCVVSFGDKPAATILEVAIKKIADLNRSVDPEAAQRIVDDRYVDDILSGGTADQVNRFAGTEINGVHNGTIATILSRGSLHLKAIVTSGETDQDKLRKMGGAVLGIVYDASTDKFYINLTKNIKQSLEALLTGVITLSICISVINSIYDPLGLGVPVTLRLRVAFRDLFRTGLNLAWEDSIPPEDLIVWRNLFTMLFDSKPLEFRRSVKPSHAVGKCELVCFFDGSDHAYAAVLYVRWNLEDGSVFVTIVNSKSRPTPLQRISTPRSELNGAVVASRLVLATLRSWSRVDLPERVWMIGDSECTLSSIEKVSGAFGEYFGNRVGEIQSNQAKIEEYCPVGENGEWWAIESKNNSADIATRLDSSWEDVGPGTRWQDGEPFLKLPRSRWPLNRDFAKRKQDHLPQAELLKKFRCLIQATETKVDTGIHNLISPLSTNFWDTLIHKTQRVLLAAQQWQSLLKSRYIPPPTPDASELKFRAKVLWFVTVMNHTTNAVKEGKLKELDIQVQDGMNVVVGRAKTGLKHFYGQNYLPVIMGDTRIANLIMTSAHWKDHAGRDITQAMARHEAWIVNAKKLAKKVIHLCVRCRYLRKSLEIQKMAVLPDSVQVQCPPFTNIGLDLTGPYIVKAMTNKRATLKVWVAIFLCLNTKAISMELAPGYSTKDFMLAYQCHTSQRGDPSLVHSDRGSQLVAAHKELSDEPLRYNWDDIAATTARNGTTWNFTPAGAQWRNGAAESFVKKFKHSFHHLYKDSKLSYAELYCAIRRISNILNHRPVSVQRTKTDAQDTDFLSPLTPNMLLMGRSASGPPQDSTNEEDPRIRADYLHELETAWWYQYKVQYFQSLIPTRKWTEAKRNITVGDIVLIEYKSKSAPGTYRLGRVQHAETDSDNLVRTCTVAYRLVKPVNMNNRDTIQDVVHKEVRLPIQRLVLILPVEEQ